MKATVLALPLLLLPLLLPAPAPDGKEEVVIYRDDFGIPHIFATTDEGAAYALGYAQAEDRLEEVLRQ
jgi:acyl-homoserine lactone acylase PvdQ